MIFAFLFDSGGVPAMFVVQDLSLFDGYSLVIGDNKKQSVS